MSIFLSFVVFSYLLSAGSSLFYLSRPKSELVDSIKDFTPGEMVDVARKNHKTQLVISAILFVIGLIILLA